MERAVYLGRDESGGCTFRLLDRGNSGQEFTISADHARKLYPNGFAMISKDAAPRGRLAMPLVQPKSVAMPGQVFQPILDHTCPDKTPRKLRVRAIVATQDEQKPGLLAYLPKGSLFMRRGYIIEEDQIHRATNRSELVRRIEELGNQRMPLLLIDLDDPGHEPLEVMPHLLVVNGKYDPLVRDILEDFPENLNLAMIPVARTIEIGETYLKELEIEGQLTHDDCAFMTLDGFAPVARRQGLHDWLKEALTSGEVLGAGGLASRLANIPHVPAADLEDCVEFLINGDLSDEPFQDPFEAAQAKAYQPSLSIN